MTFHTHGTTRELDTGDYEWCPLPQGEQEKQADGMVTRVMGEVFKVGVQRVGRAYKGDEFTVHGELGFP